MSVVSVYAVFSDGEEAERISRAVIDKRLAACANILAPMRSIYRWQGEIGSSDEVAVVFKTSRTVVDRLITQIAGMHSYDIPCIAAFPIDKILASYAEWVEDSVG